ncbi:MAG: tetratricopeptide repeat protein [Gammaproteobacteria bacterium]
MTKLTVLPDTCTHQICKLKPLMSALLYAPALFAGETVLQQDIGKFDGQQFPTTVIQLTEVVKQHPHSAEAFFYLGLAEAKQGHHAKAVAAFKRSLTLNPQQPDAELALGRSYYHLGLDNLAEKAFQDSAASSRQPGTAWFLLGLTYRKQGKYAESIDAFQHAIASDPDFAQSAWYNIGLARQELKQDALARDAFGKAARIGGDPALDSLAQQALQGEKVATQETGKKPWALSAHAGFEYDDNVTINQIDTATFLSDYAAIFDLSGSYNLIDTQRDNVQIGYDFYQSVYGELSAFDLQSHRFGASASHDTTLGSLGMDYGYTYTTLGGENFFQNHSVMPNFGFSPLQTWYVNLLYHYTNKDFFSNNPRDADQHAIGINNYWFFNNNQSFAYLGYRVENETTTGSQFSYLGNYVTAKIRSKFQQILFQPEITLGYRYFVKDYDNITPSIGDVRHDRRHTISTALDLHLTREISSRLEYQYIDAISNLQTSDFKENIVSFSMGASF